MMRVVYTAGKAPMAKMLGDYECSDVVRVGGPPYVVLNRSSELVVPDDRVPIANITTGVVIYTLANRTDFTPVPGAFVENYPENMPSPEAVAKVIDTLRAVGAAKLIAPGLARMCRDTLKAAGVPVEGD